ncbi:hypothetical protein MA16_Dca004524 [Dendrobium catenatum]|uniref:Uncharacterized protein n=1 Tax=Dendrobium catenatum TaxID=906689 RepID=A0A2I0W7Q9_9ASPA|nr:hypothetical protein MA16_Dca004524 [Dendrobium catenatum]
MPQERKPTERSRWKTDANRRHERNSFCKCTLNHFQLPSRRERMQRSTGREELVISGVITS